MLTEAGSSYALYVTAGAGHEALRVTAEVAKIASGTGGGQMAVHRVDRSWARVVCTAESGKLTWPKVPGPLAASHGFTPPDPRHFAAHRASRLAALAAADAGLPGVDAEACPAGAA
jgi:hypothetical protein